ncbi:hypothetical protein WJX79_002254 [Trebouxia sp. C0005]
MAKTLHMPSAASPGLSKAGSQPPKPKADRIRAKCIAVCRLQDLCAEDKGKVAKLLRQVVDLEKELAQCKVQTKKETNQHLRHRSADLALENSTLKAKLTHAFVLLRAYQHKIRIMNATGAAMPDPLHVPPQANCGASFARQKQPGSAITAADGVQLNQSSGSQVHLAASGQYARQEPFAELATEMRAWQHDDRGDQMSQQTAQESACKVLRFDPSLGADGAFYFVSPDATQQQSSISAERQQEPQDANAGLAAGKASPDADRATAERPACSSAAAAETPDVDAPVAACISKADEEAQGVQPEADAMSGNAQEELQSLAELHDRAQTPDTILDKNRGDEVGHSLGFDSSLMDLVAEVEQMVVCKQAHGEHRSSIASSLPGSCADLAYKVVSAQRSGGHQYSVAHQTIAVEEDFEENDVISLISDQEYSMH